MSVANTNIVGNRYLDPDKDMKFVVMSVEDWGWGVPMMMMKYEDGTVWDESSDLCGYEYPLLEVGEFPAPLSFYNEEGVLSIARKYGYKYADTFEHPTPETPDLSGTVRKSEVLDYFDWAIVRGNGVPLSIPYALDEILEDTFMDSAVPLEEIEGAILDGFVECVAELSNVWISDTDSE